ncbi:MAG: toxic anion resistance protein [Clostridia bacterium]|nr:toxic anion resistance protein [Clostridia bacterium]MBR6781277.1 toxic anion resistance protein [Clostridia bacterium]
MDNNNLPNLTLNPFSDTPPAAPVVPPEQEDMQQAAQFAQTPLTPEEQQLVDSFSAQIDLTDTTVVLQYGAAAQRKIADFSDTALESVRTKDLGEVGEMLTQLIGELRGFDEEEPKGLFGRIKKGAKKVSALQTRYATAEANVDRIVTVLEDHQIQLLKDIAVLDRLYEMNLQYFKEISLYILAGKKCLETARATTLPALLEKARLSGLPEDAQAANDFAQKCDRFEKKLHDLELTRMVAIQMAPQIRLVQNNNSVMCEKIQSTVANTIPLWKSQMVIALGLANSQNALEAQRSVTQMTNELLRKNAEALKLGTVATAQEAERGVVEIETLQQTNQMLIETLDEVARIQAEGRANRRAAEAELARLEGEVKLKLQTYSTPTEA